MGDVSADRLRVFVAGLAEEMPPLEWPVGLIWLRGALIAAGIILCLVAVWAFWWALRPARRRKRPARHGLADEPWRHANAARIADQQLADRRRDQSARLVAEISERAAGWAGPGGETRELPIREWR